MNVLGIDPGFAAIGVAVVEVTPRGERLVHSEVIRTEKSAKKREVRQSHDNVRRTQEIHAALECIAADHSIRAICCEAMSFPRSSSVAHKMGMAWGSIAALSLLTSPKLPLLEASPQDIKRALCRSKTASKEEVIAAIEVRFPDVRWPAQTGLWEHVADAAGAVVACLDNPALLMARRFKEAPF